MEISHIGIQYVRGNAKLIHQGFVGMAGRAKIRGTVAETIGTGVLNIVNTVTIRTGGNVLVALLGQCRAVDAFLVFIINGAVALGTGLRNDQLSP